MTGVAQLEPNNSIYFKLLIMQGIQCFPQKRKSISSDLFSTIRELRNAFRIDVLSFNLDAQLKVSLPCSNHQLLNCICSTP